MLFGRNPIGSGFPLYLLFCYSCACRNTQASYSTNVTKAFQNKATQKDAAAIPNAGLFTS